MHDRTCGEIAIDKHTKRLGDLCFCWLDFERNKKAGKPNFLLAFEAIQQETTITVTTRVERRIQVCIQRKRWIGRNVAWSFKIGIPIRKENNRGCFEKTRAQYKEQQQQRTNRSLVHKKILSCILTSCCQYGVEQEEY